MSKRDKITFFIDWSLGQKAIPQALESLNADVRKHLEHFPPDAPDVEWLAQISELGWVVLTKDKKISIRRLEIEAIARSQVKVFILVSGNLTRLQMADVFAKSLSKIEKIAVGNKAPFIAKIYKSGKIEVWKNRAQLLKYIK